MRPCLVVAIGSPMGLEGTVSSGVISATERHMQPDAPTIYLQTDAAINPGSSGGPLIDATGKILGINAFSVTTTGGNQGLGFAVPSNVVHNVYEQLRDRGRVVRATLAMAGQTLTPELSTGLGLSARWGVVVADVLAGGPAYNAGIEPLDVIVSVGGFPVETARELRSRLLALAVGDLVEIDILRGATQTRVVAATGARAGDPAQALLSVNASRKRVPRLNAVGVNLTEQTRQFVPQAVAETGVLVVDVEPGATTRDELVPGDVLVSINRVPTPDMPALQAELARHPEHGLVVATVERAGARVLLVVELD